MRKKILYTASTSGHLMSFHVPYLNALSASGYEVHTAANGPVPNCQGITYHYDIPFEKKIQAIGNFRQAIHLSHIIRENQYDLIITNTSLAAFFTRVAVQLAGKGAARVVNIAHGYLFDDNTSFAKRTLFLAAEKVTSSVTDDILTMNQQDLVIADRYKLCCGNVIPIEGMGIDCSRYRMTNEDSRIRWRKNLILPESAFILVYAAEFSERKNQAFLLRSLSRLPSDVVLVLPGRGELLDTCKSLATELGLTNRVVFPGFVQDIEHYYMAADICVSASRSEGLPFNIMEAMSCGLPVIASHVKGHEDLITNGETGYLFPWEDQDAFCHAVEKLYTDRTLVNVMGENSHIFAQQYDLERVLPKTIQAMLGEQQTVQTEEKAAVSVI